MLSRGCLFLWFLCMWLTVRYHGHHRLHILLSCRSRQRERLNVCVFVCLSVCLLPKWKNAIFSKTKQFRAMVSIDDLQEVVHGLFKEPIIGPIKSKIRCLENRHGVIFFCRGRSHLDKILQTSAEWHVDCSDMVEIETRSRIDNNNKQIYKVPCMPIEGCRGAIPIWWTFGRIQWHVIPEPPVTLQGAATGRIQWHMSSQMIHVLHCRVLPLG